MSGPTARVEARLRAVLIDLRPADGAPPRLRSRILDVPERMPRHPAVASLRPFAIAATGIAAIGLALAGVERWSVPIPGNGSSPTLAIGIDPAIEGPGLVTWMFPTLPLVSWAVAAAFAIVALMLFRRRHGGGPAVLPTIAAALLAVGALTLQRVPGPGVGGSNAWGPVLGLRVGPEAGATSESGVPISTFYEIARPGEPFVFSFWVNNAGPVPIRLEGIVEDPEAASRFGPRWTALALGTDANAVAQPIDELVPFSRVELEPGGFMPLYVVGKASACAVGPSFGGPDQAFALRGPDIQLAYSVFGFTSTSTYTMPLVIQEPIREGCTG
jgi:hypothetical protein